VEHSPRFRRLQGSVGSARHPRPDHGFHWPLVATGDKDFKNLNDSISAEQSWMKSLARPISADTKVLTTVSQDVVSISARFNKLSEDASRFEKIKGIPEWKLANNRATEWSR
jgi:hypothetical protein